MPIVLGYDAQAIPSSPNLRKPRAGLRKFHKEPNPFDKKTRFYNTKKPNPIGQINLQRIHIAPKDSINDHDTYFLLDSLAQTLANLQIESKLNESDDQNLVMRILAQFFAVTEKNIEHKSNHHTRNFTLDFRPSLEADNNYDTYRIKGTIENKNRYKIDWNIVSNTKEAKEQKIISLIYEKGELTSYQLPNLSDKQTVFLALLRLLLQTKTIIDSGKHTSTELEDLMHIIGESKNFLEYLESIKFLSLRDCTEFHDNYFGNEVMIQKTNASSYQIKINAANNTMILEFSFDSKQHPRRLSFRQEKAEGLDIKFIYQDGMIYPEFSKLKALDISRGSRIIPR